MSLSAFSREIESEKTINSSPVPTLSSHNATEAFRQQQMEREHLKDITIKLKMLVDKKKSLDKTNRYLQQERDTMERERATRFAEFTEIFEEKVNKITRGRDLVKQEVDDMHHQIEESSSSKHEAEKKLAWLVKDKDAYKSQLGQAQNHLAAEESKAEKMHSVFDRLEGEKKKLEDEYSLYKKQNTKLTILKSKLEKKLTSEKKVSNENKICIDKLRSKLMAQEDLLIKKMNEKRLLFEREKESFQTDFEKEQTAHHTKKIEEFKKDKVQWMNASKSQLEKMILTLNETNERLELEVKVLEDQNEEHRTTITKLKRGNTTVLKREETEITEIRQQSMEKYHGMELKYKAEIASSRKNKVTLDKAQKELELELAGVKKTTKRKLDELETNIRQHQQQNEKLKQLLRDKESRLIKLQQEHVDYFQEINTLQGLLASAEDTVISTVDDRLLNATRPAKRPRL